MNLDEMSGVIAAPPKWDPTLGAVGAPQDLDSVRLGEYVAAVRASLDDDLNRMVVAYRGLRTVREELGLPLLRTGVEGEARGGLTVDENQRFVVAATLVDNASRFLDDALSGDRRVGWDDQRQFVVEALPTDGVRIEIRPGIGPVLIGTQTGEPVEITGSLSGPALLIVGGLIAGVAVTAAAVYAIKLMTDSLTVAAQEKTTQTIVERGRLLVESGKATPEQVARLDTAVLEGTRAIREEERKKAEADKPTGDIAGAVKTVAWAAVAVGALYFGAQLIPKRTHAEAAA